MDIGYELVHVMSDGYIMIFKHLRDPRFRLIEAFVHYTLKDQG